LSVRVEPLHELVAPGGSPATLSWIVELNPLLAVELTSNCTDAGGVTVVDDGLTVSAKSGVGATTCSVITAVWQVTGYGTPEHVTELSAFDGWALNHICQ
jgi:hypothetical protein